MITPLNACINLEIFRTGFYLVPRSWLPYLDPLRVISPGRDTVSSWCAFFRLIVLRILGASFNGIIAFIESLDLYIFSRLMEVISFIILCDNVRIWFFSQSWSRVHGVLIMYWLISRFLQLPWVNRYWATSQRYSKEAVHKLRNATSNFVDSLPLPVTLHSKSFDPPKITWQKNVPPPS